MQKTPSFSEQFDKITRAYSSDELNPLDPCGCFIGTIQNCTNQWAILKVYSRLAGSIPVSAGLKDPEYSFYTMEEIIAMEQNFLCECYIPSGTLTEATLFRAMETTLDMLQTIHEAKGEVTGHVPVKRRQPVS